MAVNSTALCSLAQVRSLLSMTTDTSKDTLLEMIINAVSKQFEEYCRRSFSSATHTEYYDGDGSTDLWVKQWPITSITSIYNCTTIPPEFASAELEDSTYYAADDDAAGRIVFYNSFLYHGRRNVKVTYVAGYSRGTGPGETDDALPFDLQFACARHCARVFSEIHDKRDGLASKSLNDGSTTYIKDIEPSILQTLDEYRPFMI